MYTECVHVDAILVCINFRDIVIIIQNPLWNVDEIDHKTGNVTFNDGGISIQHVFVHYINGVSLCYHCGRPIAKRKAKNLRNRIEKREREGERVEQTWNLDWSIDVLNSNAG